MTINLNKLDSALIAHDDIIGDDDDIIIEAARAYLSQQKAPLVNSLFVASDLKIQQGWNKSKVNGVEFLVSRKEAQGWNSCVDYLHDNGLLSQQKAPEQDVRSVTVICATTDKDGNTVTTTTDHEIPVESKPLFDPIAHAHGDVAEVAYWDFSARRGGDGEYKLRPQSERDAFKQVFRNYLTQRPAAPPVAAQVDLEALKLECQQVHAKAFFSGKRHGELLDSVIDHLAAKGLINTTKQQENE